MGKREHPGLSKKNKGGNPITRPNNNPGVCIWQLRVRRIGINLDKITVMEVLLFRNYDTLARLKPLVTESVHRLWSFIMNSRVCDILGVRWKRIKGIFLSCVCNEWIKLSKSINKVTSSCVHHSLTLRQGALISK